MSGHEQRSSKASIIIKNALFLFTGKGISAVLGLLTVSIVARSLGVANFGIYALALTVASIFAVVADFGLNFLLVREVAMNRDRSSVYLVSVSLLKILLILPSILIILIISRLFYPSFPVRSAIYLAFMAAILFTFLQFVTSFFNGHEKMGYTAAILACHSALLLGICVTIVIYKQANVNNLLFGHIIAAGMMAGLAALFLLRVLPIRQLTFSASLCGQTLRKAVPFGLFFLLGVIFFRVDIIMLSMMKGKEAVGLYWIAFRIIVAVELFPALFTEAVYPTLSRSFAESSESARLIIEKALRFMLLVGLPIALTMFFLSDKIILIFGKHFLQASKALRILSLMVALRFCAYVLGITLTASGKQKYRTMMAAICVAGNIALNFLLIPRYGYEGAALASVTTAAILVAGYYLLVVKLVCPLHLFRLAFGPTLAAGAMVAAILLLQGMGVVLAIFIGGIIYLAGLVLFRAIAREDYLMLKSLAVRERPTE